MWTDQVSFRLLKQNTRIYTVINIECSNNSDTTEIAVLNIGCDESKEKRHAENRYIGEALEDMLTDKRNSIR